MRWALLPHGWVPAVSSAAVEWDITWAWSLVSTWQEAAPPQKALLGWWFRGAGDVQHIVGISSSASSVTQSCGTCATPAERLLCWEQLYAIPDIPGQGGPEQ